MLMVKLLAAVGVASAPVMINESVRILPHDYPWQAKGAEGCGIAVLNVDAAGTPTACTLTGSTRNAALDTATCSVLMRSRYLPARDAGGAPVEGTIKRQINWNIRPGRTFCPPLAPAADGR